ncbi:amino acid adenylation domain-containing protein [Mycobacterium sp. AMU20-3851]|uniref:amino acid adenylation domain-containing protein n=1 Tax=Mycobacterium sp. AMU20-3851 TaxID=3122055 RepID=UPI00375437D3
MGNSTDFSCIVVGEGALAINCAKALLDRGHRIIGVMPADRSLRVWSESNGLPTAGPAEDMTAFCQRQEFDYLFSIVNFKIIPPEVLAIPRRGAINFHDAPLPRYAGMNAVSWALINGERTHAVSWHMISEEIDAGAILNQRAIEIADRDTALTLNVKCYEAGLAAFAELIPALETGTARPWQQDAADRSYFSRLDRPARGGVISFSDDAHRIDALVRALDFGPFRNRFCSAKVAIGNEFYLVGTARPLDTRSEKAPGTILRCGAGGIIVASATDDVELDDIRTLDGAPVTPTSVVARHGLAEGRQLSSFDASASARLESTELATSRHEAFWVKRLAELRPAVVPVLIRRQGERRPTAPAARRAQLARPVLAYLDRHDDLSAADLVFCAFGVYLSRIGDLSAFDVWVTDPALMRLAADAPGLVSERVPVRVQVAPSLTCAEAVDTVRAAARNARERGPYALDLAARYPSLRDAAGPATSEIAVEVMFEAESGSRRVHPNTLTLVLPHDGDEYEWLYDAEAVDADTLARIDRHLSSVLGEIACAADDVTIDELKPALLTPTERAELVGAGPVPVVLTSDETLHAGFARQVAANPDAIALSAQTPTGRMELSYAELDARAEAIAAHLRELGIGAGQVVGLRVERSPEVVIGILAILKAGAAYLPMDPLYPTDRIAFMLTDAAVRVVLTQHTFLDELHTLPVHTVCLDQPLQDQPLPPVTTPTPPPAEATSADLAYVMYTSGSTGKPKGVRVTHHNVLRLFAATIPHFGFGPDDVWTLWHSYSFDISVSELWGALLAGARLVIVTQDTSRDPAAFRALVEREHVTVMSQTPTGFQAFIDIDHTAPPADFALRYILLCGEALHLQSLQPWFDRYGDHTPQIINMYGPTEATLYVTHQRISQADLDAGAGSIIGTPLPDIRIYLLDPRGEPVPTGVAGELHIAGAGVAAGYLNRPDLNTERFLPDPFHGGPMYRTGDLARRLQHGELEYLGRIDQQVKIRGFRIELGEIETTIAAHPDVHQVAVIDHENAPGDKELIAYLVAPTAGPTLITDLRQTLREHLPEYMIPAHFHHLDELPLTTSGKLDRKALPTPTRQRTHTTTAYTAPRNPAEQTIADIWKTVLRIDKVGLDDHFFELGGHSLLLVRAHSRLTHHFRTDLPVVALLQYPTVRTLARHIAGHHNHNTTEATMTRARKQREAFAHQRKLTGRR